MAFGIGRKLKKAGKKIREATGGSTGALDPFGRGATKSAIGLDSPLGPYIKDQIRGKVGEVAGHPRLTPLSKKGTRQIQADVQRVEEYFSPEEPELSPDPQIAEDAKREAARRRARTLGRSMLMTSRRRRQALGV